MARIHVIGGGLAGLAAALRLSQNTSHHITLYEATQRAGGRCRSFHDETLGGVIDNGNHLVMGGNKNALTFLDEIGARDRLIGKTPAAFPFIDLATGERWVLRPNHGLIPWWVFKRDRRIPDTGVLSYATALGILRATQHQTVTDTIPPKGAAYDRMWEPLTVAAINTDPAHAAAALMKPVLLKTFGRGEKGCRPMIAKDSLADTFVDPALKTLEDNGVNLRFNARLREMAIENASATHLSFGEETPVELSKDDKVILALPAWDIAAFIPDMDPPDAGDPIVNVHYRLPEAPVGFDDVDLIGVIGGFAQWIFIRGDMVSITISAAVTEAAMNAEDVALRCWADVCIALNVSGPLPPHRVIKERRATFKQTPDALKKRSGPATTLTNTFIAGDWTDTGLPATIEGAILSGNRAAKAVARARL